MQKITLKSHAKINLALDILGIENEYHFIQTVYQKIDMHDEVTIELNDSGEIQCDGKLATQAAKTFFEKIGSKKGVTITIQKNIPYYSGLGGASSNAAAVLRGLSELFQNPLSQKELFEIAEKLGMDVPFFASGCDTALGTHFGEKITKLPQCPKLNYEFYFPEAKKSSTKDMYEKLDLAKCGKNTNKTEKLITALKEKDENAILQNIHNDFEQLWPKPKSHTSHITSHTFLTGAGPTWVIIPPPVAPSSPSQA
ncbi:MAG: 4-(cytidine 5'-diphospho)-2-C-methyl-D-erythritol kinase [Patescibacteria group bacterium]